MSAVERPPGVVHGRVCAASYLRILPADVVADALWMAKLARGSSWPNEMAQRVDDAADRVIRALGGQS